MAVKVAASSPGQELAAWGEVGASFSTTYSPTSSSATRRTVHCLLGPAASGLDMAYRPGLHAGKLFRQGAQVMGLTTARGWWRSAGCGSLTASSGCMTCEGWKKEMGKLMIAHPLAWPLPGADGPIWTEPTRLGHLIRKESPVTEPNAVTRNVFGVPSGATPRPDRRSSAPGISKGGGALRLHGP